MSEMNKIRATRTNGTNPAHKNNKNAQRTPTLYVIDIKASLDTPPPEVNMGGYRWGPVELCLI